MEETPDPGTPGTPGPTDSDFPSGWPIERIPLAGASGQTVLELVELPETEDDSDEIFRQYRDWVESASPGTVSPVILVTLPGARIFWAPGRAVAVASRGLLEALSVVYKADHIVQEMQVAAPEAAAR